MRQGERLGMGTGRGHAGEPQAGAGGGAVGAAFVRLGGAGSVGFVVHQSLGNQGHLLAQTVAIGALLKRRAKGLRAMVSVGFVRRVALVLHPDLTENR